MTWKKGETGNPKGRPRSGNALTEAIRRKVNVDDFLDDLIRIAKESPSDQTRLRAMEILSSLGWKKPAQVVEVGPSDPYEDYTEDELKALIAEDDEELAEIEGEEPKQLEASYGEAGISQATGISPATGITESDKRVGISRTDCSTESDKEARPRTPGTDPAESRTTLPVGAERTLLAGVLRRPK